MSTRVQETTERYETLLDEALASVEFEDDLGDDQHALAVEHVEMARSYLEDGRHFLADDEYATALAAFSYGHGWLDAAVRSNLIDATHAASTPEPGGV